MDNLKEVKCLKFLVLKRRTLILFFIISLTVASASVWFLLNSDSMTAFNQTKDEIREIHLVTGEFKSKTEDGKEIEAYRWDPGTIFIEKGETVRLKIYGVNGHEHPFFIEGTDIKGTVKKGEETIVPLKFDKEGTYRLICPKHADKDHNGPMIAYIVVD